MFKLSEKKYIPLSDVEVQHYIDDKFKTKYSKNVEYTFTVPGIYAYWCTPHKSMGMIGFIVVGNDKSNLEDIKKIKYFSKSKKIAPELINSL